MLFILTAFRFCFFCSHIFPPNVWLPFHLIFDLLSNTLHWLFWLNFLSFFFFLNELFCLYCLNLSRNLLYHPSFANVFWLFLCLLFDLSALLIWSSHSNISMFVFACFWIYLFNLISHPGFVFLIGFLEEYRFNYKLILLLHIFAWLSHWGYMLEYLLIVCLTFHFQMDFQQLWFLKDGNVIFF